MLKQAIVWAAIFGGMYCLSPVEALAAGPIRRAAPSSGSGGC
jgi:hypothetical protein